MMSPTTTKTAFWQGFRDGAPFLLMVAPFALLFGVVATEAGLSLVEAMAFSVLVVAGASQMAVIQLMTDNAPAFIAILTGLTVNLRMAMYSASLTPHLGKAPLWKRATVAYLLVDQAYAVSIVKFDQKPDWPVSVKLAYYFGVMAPVLPLWYGFSYIGAVVGATVPPEYALDFAMPIAFLALIAPALRTLAHVAAALTSIVLALLLAAVPLNLGLIIAAIGAMMVGARVELWLEKQT
jgi:predicted branched-subunit amino acid permease